MAFNIDDAPDDDELYNDYVEDTPEEQEEPPMEIADEDAFILDASRIRHGATQESVVGGAEESAATVSATATTGEVSRVPGEHRIDLLGGEVESSDKSTTVRAEFTRIRAAGKTDVFAYERYNPGVAWRDDVKKSPSHNVMTAKVWKASLESIAATGLNESDYHSDRQKRCAPSTPDSQLLQYLDHRNLSLFRSGRCNTGQQTICRGLRRNPTQGKKHCTMTLGDGIRVHIPIENSEDGDFVSRQLNKSRNKKTHLLTVSMEVLLERVNLLRRRKEVDLLRSHSRKVDNEILQDNILQNTASKPNCQLWVDKHAPVSFAHLLSEEKTNREVLRALRSWDPYVFKKEAPPVLETSYQPKGETSNLKGNVDQTKAKGKMDSEESKSKLLRPDQSSRVILLSGPPGVGKTTLAHIVARHAGYRPFEVNGSDDRSGSALTEIVLRAMESTTPYLSKEGRAGSYGRPNCLILDEIDGVEARGILELVEIIRAERPLKASKGSKKNTILRRPIIFICNNKYAPSLRPLLPYARQFDVSPPQDSRLVARLRAVLQMENLSIPSTILHQLVASAGGDIRSCLFSLQFASSAGMAEADSSLTDLVSKTLLDSLSGRGLKDGSTDVSSVLRAVFRKRKKGCIEDVSEIVERSGDYSRILDCLLLNLLRVSYIDPTMDRCAAGHEWLSSSDIYRSFGGLTGDYSDKYMMEALQIPCSATALNILCAVERQPDLVYSTRELVATRFQQEANESLTQRFVDGLSLKVKRSRCLRQMATETIPYVLWIMSAGEGSITLHRGATSIALLNNGERLALHRHVEVLCSLGLTYSALNDTGIFNANFNNRNPKIQYILDPPLERLVDYKDSDAFRGCQKNDIPPVMKEMLAREAGREQVRENINKSGDVEKDTKIIIKASNIANSSQSAKPVETTRVNKRIEPDKSNISDSPSKRSRLVFEPKKCDPIIDKKGKTTHYFGTTSSRTGLVRLDSSKLSNTGSGLRLSQVIRLKYVKGFTQAVRTPCCTKDLL